HVEITRLGSIAFAASATLRHLRPFIFSNHRLHLQEHSLLRGFAWGTIQIDDGSSVRSKLLAQDGVMHLAAAQSVRSENEERLDGTFGNEIPQAFQRRTP